jgi:tetratricopeptide (TPR) repeat protein
LATTGINRLHRPLKAEKNKRRRAPDACRKPPECPDYMPAVVQSQPLHAKDRQPPRPRPDVGLAPPTQVKTLFLLTILKTCRDALAQSRPPRLHFGNKNRWFAREDRPRIVSATRPERDWTPPPSRCTMELDHRINTIRFHRMTTPTLAELQSDISSSLERRDWTAAAAAAAACRESYPAVLQGWLLGSFIALMAGRKDDALTLADGGVALAPENVSAAVQQAECLWALDRRDAALAAIRRAETLAGNDAQGLIAVAEFLTHARERTLAIGIYDRAIGAHPAVGSLYARRGMLHRELGHFNEAAADFDQAIRVDPNDAESLKARAELAGVAPGTLPVAALEAALARNSGDPAHAVPLHFALAEAYDAQGDADASWRHLTAGNRLERSRLRYNPALDRAMFERLASAFTEAAPPASGQPDSPIFVVGLPRTGTTLVERILASHSQVHDAGEIPSLSEAIGAFVDARLHPAPPSFEGYLESLPLMPGDTLRAEYLRRAAPWRGDRPRFTDKNTLNFFYIPLILRAFPDARIVHLTRHPLAAAYAIYKVWFRGAFPFSYDLPEFADFYTGYRDLMAHWHRLNPGRILDVAYEDLVSHQESQTRRLLDYCGLPFEENCLQFHEQAGAVATASYRQVRQPMYDSSLTHWQRYADQLEPVRSRLAARGIAVDPT